MSISDDIAAATLGAIKSALDGGRLYIFNGPVPADADTALDMDTLHTELIVMTESNDGITGLTFDAPVGSSMGKAAAEVWEGLIGPFDGANDTAPTLAPTFYRFCGDGDDGRGAAVGPRLQGTCGGPSSGAALAFDTDTFTPDTVSTKGVGIFAVVVSQS